ncbi:MAG: biotin--[acetyl-CoA-carboxylase] ligase [Candidatus Cloacimonetes bacterium]|nr:biotin--[acetyl-CoA-carboxylase] ligase [Candidatus Cloacimonadota bacterium]
MREIPFFDQIINYQKTDSTFIRAKNLILSKDVQGNFLCIAETQTVGKGRNDKYWFSPIGGLWMTAGFYNLPLKSSLTLYLAISIVNALIKLYPEIADNVYIKWPNDLILKNKKLGGILTSAYPNLKYILSGIGLNTNNREFPSELNNIAISLSEYVRKLIDNELLLYEIFNNFAEGLPDYLDNELGKLKQLFNERFSYLKNKKVHIQTKFEELHGVAKGINDKGALILLLENGTFLPVYSGSVTKIDDITII